jgi:branched-subunit amino acid aminotransferase/4-amino-4-deoxychorismate lyase
LLLLDCDKRKKKNIRSMTTSLVLSRVSKPVLTSLLDARRRTMFVDVAGSVATSQKLIPTSEVVAAAQELITSGDALSTSDNVPIIYDVLRVKGRHPVFYAQHMQRFLNSLCSFAERQSIAGAAELMSTSGSYCKSVDDVVAEDAARWPDWFRRFDSAVRDVIAAQPEDDVEQNVKVIAWLEEAERDASTPAATASHPASRLSIAAFFITSTYPPSLWYEPGGGTHVALLYHAARSNPNAKIVQAPLRLRAAEQQKRLGAFESLLVHGPEDQFKVPEGSRSNLLCVIVTKDNGVSVVGSLDKDILVGVTLSALRQRVGAYHRATPPTSTQDEVLRFEWEQRDVVLADVLNARSLVMLGTSVGVLPISTVTVFERGLADGRSDEAVFRQYVQDNQCDDVAVEVNGETGVGFIKKPSTTDPVVRLLVDLYRDARLGK